MHACARSRVLHACVRARACVPDGALARDLVDDGRVGRDAGIRTGIRRLLQLQQGRPDAHDRRTNEQEHERDAGASVEHVAHKEAVNVVAQAQQFPCDHGDLQ